MATNPKTLEFYFDTPELTLHPLLRRIAHLLINAWLCVIGVTAVVLVISEVEKFRYLGLFVLIYLGNKLVHLGKPADSLAEIPGSGRVNLFYYTVPQAISAILGAEEASALFGGKFLLHLAYGLSNKKEIQGVLRRLDVNAPEFRVKIKEYLDKSLPVKNNRDETRALIENLAQMSLEQAISGQGTSIGLADVFAGLGNLGDKDIEKIFELFSLKAPDLEKAMVFARFRRKLGWFNRPPRDLGGFAGGDALIRHRFMNRAWTARPTPNLDKFSTDFTDMARAGRTGFMIGHEKEYQALLNILSRPNEPNALLVGEAGSGTGTLVTHLAYMITRDEVPAPIFDKRVVALDLGALLAGAEEAKLRERLQIIFSEILQAGNIILFIPDIHNLARTSETNRSLEISNIILPIIVSNNFPVIGSTYPQEFKKYIETDSSFADALEVVRLEEVTLDEAEKILAYKSIIFEEIYKIEITYGAIRTAVDLAHRYFHGKLLPASADDLLKDTLVEASRRGVKALTPDDVIQAAERRVNVPIGRASEKEVDKLLNLEVLIHQKLIDQDIAVKAVSRALREYRSGLSRKGGPIGTFLFVGPTGVGKTELSKILATIQFGSQEAMVRLDMSEYQDKQSLYRFIGSPNGEILGSLTNAIIEKPYSLVLLDEFEKAHPDILNLFLQVFDDGRLTDNFGRVVSFENTIIIATSNAHSEFVQGALREGQAMSGIEDELKHKLIDYFKPELLNRFSSIVVFKALSQEDIVAIAGLQLKQFASGLKESHNASMEFSESAVKKIAEWGYDPAFGARPLREVISQRIKEPLADKILRKELFRGAKVRVDLEGEELKFNFI